MCDQFLVRVYIAATLHRRGLCPAKRLRVPDQHDGKRAGRELPQNCGVKLGQNEVRQARWKMADHAYAGGLTAEQANDDGRQDGDDERGGHAGCQMAKQQHCQETERAGQHRGK